MTHEFGNDPNIEQVFTPGWETKSLSTLSYGLTASAHAATRGSQRPDVALVMNVANGYYLPLLKAANIRTVVNVDGIEWHRDKWSSSAKAVFRRGAAMTARWADEIVCDSTRVSLTSGGVHMDGRAITSHTAEISRVNPIRRRFQEL